MNEHVAIIQARAAWPRRGIDVRWSRWRRLACANSCRRKKRCTCRRARSCT